MPGEDNFVLISAMNPTRPRYIIALCDGTGKNGFKDDHRTNVYKLYNRILNSKCEGPTVVDNVQYEVVAQYFPGIGCETAAAPGILSKLFGAGIVKMVAQVYMFILNSYRHGDRVCIFGYSRGAWIARKVASLLFHIGRSVKEEKELLEQWKHREIGVPWARKLFHDPIPVEWVLNNQAMLQIIFDSHYNQQVPGGLGHCAIYSLSRLTQLKDLMNISETELYHGVKHALHAVAFHENRQLFRVSLFDKEHGDRLQEVWFAGSHSDVGGGGKPTVLSDITLNWMIQNVDAFSKLRTTPISYEKLKGTVPRDAFNEYPTTKRAVDMEETRIDSNILTQDSRIHPTVELIESALPFDTRLATVRKLREVFKHKRCTQLPRIEAQHEVNQPTADPEAPNPTVISSGMEACEVLIHLRNHGCSDLTDQLDLAACNSVPFAGGGSGDVFKGRLKGGIEIAIKTTRRYINGSGEGIKELKHMARELHIWAQCDHPNVHGDVKGSNILVSDMGVPLLTDFGNSILQNSTLQFTATTSPQKLSQRYTAPEVLIGKASLSQEADVQYHAKRIPHVTYGH
ncbi:Tyrosine-protein kinase SPK-1 [Ceratobasidium sp. AG-Ba]|nr:Tyrosine-protein kinase SPK-1 [Ceratobasidium sp. AG-Ba]